MKMSPSASVMWVYLFYLLRLDGSGGNTLLSRSCKEFLVGVLKI